MASHDFNSFQNKQMGHLKKAFIRLGVGSCLSLVVVGQVGSVLSSLLLKQ